MNLSSSKWLVLIPVILSLAVHSNVLQNGYGWDDETLIRNFRDPAHAWRMVTQILPESDERESDRLREPYFRPVISLSYILDYLVWGEGPFGFHFSVWLIHGLNAGLVFLLARNLFVIGRTQRAAPAKVDEPPESGRNALRPDNVLPLIAGSLFAVHPIHAEAVAWIAGRSDVFCTTLLLLSFLLYSGWHASGSGFRYAASMLFFGLALLTKETAYPFAFLFPLFDFLSPPIEASPFPAGPLRIVRRAAIRSAVPFIFLGAAVIGRTGQANLPFGGPTFVPADPPPAWIEGLSALGLYLKMMLFPHPFQPYVSDLPAGPLVTIGSGLAVAGLAVTFLWACRRYEWVPAFGLAWMAASLAPVLWIAFFRISLPSMAERYVYTPSVGFLFAAVWIGAKGWNRLARYSSNPRGMRIAAAIGLVMLLGWGAGQSWARHPVWKSQLSFWEAAVATSPLAGQPYRQLGILRLGQGRAAEAEHLFRQALALDEKRYGSDHFLVANTLHRLADLALNQKRYEESEKLYLQAIAIREDRLGGDHPALAESLNNLGVLYRLRGHFLESESLYARALRIRERSLGPDHEAVATSLNNLAVLFHFEGRPDLAEPYYRRALSILEKTEGVRGFKTVQTAENLAELLREGKRAEEAEAVEERYGPGNPGTN